jgi:hypothetical protein
VFCAKVLLVVHKLNIQRVSNLEYLFLHSLIFLLNKRVINYKGQYDLSFELIILECLIIHNTYISYYSKRTKITKLYPRHSNLFCNSPISSSVRGKGLRNRICAIFLPHLSGK